MNLVGLDNYVLGRVVKHNLTFREHTEKQTKEIW